MHIPWRVIAGVALLVPLVLLPTTQGAAQPTIETPQQASVEDCDKLRQEIEQLERELEDIRVTVKELDAKIHSLSEHMKQLRELMNDPFWSGGWIPGLRHILAQDMQMAFERDVHWRSSLIKELRQEQERVAEIRKQLDELLKRLQCDPPRTTREEPQPPQQVGQAPPLKLAPANQRILDLHNGERVAVGAPPLQWDPALAQTATAYASEMARTGKLTHASRQGRGVARENINQAFHGSSPNQLMANWLNEKRNFVSGIFPNVSRTGNWADVGHYSQIIWPETTHVGCGSARGARWDYFVCRYSPGGNKDGQPVGFTTAAN